MPSVDHTSSKHFFNRSFDSASQNTNESSHGPSARSRRTVPYVNERREFDPRFDPRSPETINQHLRQDPFSDPDPESGSDAEIVFHSQFSTFSDEHKASVLDIHQGNRSLMHPERKNEICTRAANYFTQRRQCMEQPSVVSSDVTPKAGTAGFFKPSDARFDRPFDELSKDSFGGTDSLEEMLQQEISPTSTETEGNGYLDITLSAIEERPSLEAGSLSYSLTQYNPSMTSNGIPAEIVNSPKSAASEQSEKPAVRITVEQGKPPDRDSFREKSSLEIQTAFPSETFLFADFEPKKSVQGSPRSPHRRKVSPTVPSPVESRSTAASSSPMTATETLSAATTSLCPSSEAPKSEAERLVQNFNSSPRRRQKSDTESHAEHAGSPIPGDSSKSTSDPSSDDTQTLNSEEKDLTLHDLCGESSSTDDIAWRNALYLLSTQPNLALILDGAGWTPLHVACLGSAPPPTFMTRALLYVYRGAARKVDGGGRLPLHLVAASSGDTETMQLLIEEYPQAVHHTDCQGWTPLHLMLKNFSVDVTLEHCRILLGLTLPVESPTKSSRLLQRRGEHLNLRVEELYRLVSTTSPVSRLAQEAVHEEAFKKFPEDVQNCFRRLYQWKRKQHRMNSTASDEDAVELEMATSLDAETNPAAHFTPNNGQLPIHIIVRRGLSNLYSQQTHEIDEPDDMEQSTSTAPKFLELVRLFIAFYPEGLIARDVNGYTPLLTALLMGNMQPSEKLVELLLGKRTSGFNALPPWAHNMPLYNFSADRYLNPAMIPTKNSQQLPLHVVAEEMGASFSMLSAVHETYPGAIQVQDARGRTPLHILLRNYQRIPPDPRVVTLLLSDKVAQTFDDDGKLPFDLLAESAHRLPRENPRLSYVNGNAAEGNCDSFKTFFQGTILASSKPKARNRLKADSFLWRLRTLPPWLRRQACSASFVQELLLEELASPLKCALILLYALLLALIIFFFRLEMEKFIKSSAGIISSWNELVLYGLAVGLTLYQIVFWSVCVSMSDFLNLCVFNIWRWVDVAAILLTATTTIMANHFPSVSDEAVLTTGTVATGLLWLSTIGFFSSWWYGAALFSASVQRVSWCSIVY
jgi:hypothetical protein